MYYLVSFFLGALSSFFVDAVKHKLYLFSFMCLRRLGVEPYFHILNERRSQKFFNNVILLDVNEEEFSIIANKYMKKANNTKFIITNTKEPRWFYKTFRDSVFSDDGCNVTVQDLLKSFEENNFNLEKANEIIEKLIKIFYEDNENDIKIFPHLRNFNTNGNIEKVRINFLDLNLNNPASLNAFTEENNKKHHLFFFEKFINYKVNSWFQEVGRYKGTDALILNNKIILNHDDSINELYYQRNCFAGKTNSGFFCNVIKDCRDKEKKYKRTSEILEKGYGIKV